MRTHDMLAAVLLSVTLTAVAGCTAQAPEQTAAPAAGATGLDRTVLPIAEPNYPRATELDARNAKAPPRFEVKAPQGAPNVIVFLIDDIGFGHPSTFGGQIPMPTLDRLASQGLKYNRFHTTALCSPTRVAHPDRPQPPHEQRRRDHGSGDGVPGQHRRAAAERHAAGRDPAPERLQHRRVRQVSRDGAVGSQRVRAVRSLADAFRLRQVLRLHRRRDQPVGAADLRRHGQGGGAARPELPLHHRHDEPGDPVDPQPAVADAGQAVLHLLRHRRHACAASRAEGLDREVQGQVRRRLGQVPRGDLRAAEAAGHHPAEREAGRPSPPTSRTGTRSRPTRSGCSRGRWKCSRRSPRTPTTRSAAS